MYSSEHLVLDLNEVPRVEERALGEEGIAYILRLGIEGAVLAERVAFRV